jgi:hypothetical protein
MAENIANVKSSIVDAMVAAAVAAAPPLPDDVQTRLSVVLRARATQMADDAA